jgi:hypothetical protein
VQGYRVRGQAQLHAQGVQVADDVRYIGPEQRFSTGEADLVDAETVHEQPGDRRDLAARHKLLAPQEMLVLRHAVGAAQIAFVHDADAQAAVGASVAVGQHARKIGLCRGVPLAELCLSPARMRSFVLITALLPAIPGTAQLLFDRIGTEQGLPADEVHALFEDREGFIWVGTTDGLARLEGTRVRTFHHDPIDSTSLAHDQVNGIDQAADGTLWFATMNGLSCYQPRSGTFINQRVTATGNDALQANRMRQVVAVGDTLLWVVTEAGLFRGDPRDGSLSSVQDLPPGQGPAGSMRSNSSLHWDPWRATLWAATAAGHRILGCGHRSVDGPPQQCAAPLGGPLAHRSAGGAGPGPLVHAARPVYLVPV